MAQKLRKLLFWREFLADLRISDDSMAQKLRKLLFWGAVLASFRIADFLLSEPKQWISEFLPWTVFRLNTDLWLGLVLTFASSLLAFFIGIGGGYLIGILVACTIIDTPGTHPLLKFGRNADRVLDMIYVVPLVLTLSLSYAVLLYLLEHGLPRFMIAFFLIGVAGMTLGGYNVYKSIYQSVYQAKRESRYLIESLFFTKERRRSLLQRLIPNIYRVKQFRDCEISSFCESLPRAFHLSIVAVVILETITTALYEFIIPQAGAVKPWLGGVGRQILTAQQSTQFQVIAGCIWAILFFDGVFVNLLDFFVNRHYLKYYKERL